jgi:hypothetical protein
MPNDAVDNYLDNLWISAIFRWISASNLWTDLWTDFGHPADWGLELALHHAQPVENKKFGAADSGLPTAPTWCWD